MRLSKRRYVRREPMAPPVLPKDQIVGRTFVEANGIELEAIWAGKGPLPGSTEWPAGSPGTLRTIGHPVVTP